MGKFNYYNHIAPIYDQTRWLTEPIAEEVAEIILDRVGATAETSFLEPGVGTGLNVLPLVKRGYAVTGIDISAEMLNQFRQKLGEVPQNLTLIQADASHLPFENDSFDVVLTVHMVHTVQNWQIFLDEIDRVLKPNGFYINAQWITPPARLEFERYFRTILAKDKGAKKSNSSIAEINVDDYFCGKGYQSSYQVAKEWKVKNSVAELLDFLKSRAYGLCWQVSEEIFDRAIAEFETFCVDHYSSLATELSSEAKFEIWAYTAN